jgi:hypothetical protein
MIELIATIRATMVLRSTSRVIHPILLRMHHYQIDEPAWLLIISIQY